MMSEAGGASGVPAFSRLAARKKQTEATNAIKAAAAAAGVKRRQLMATLGAQLQDERVDTPQFAARRELPCCYTKEYELEELTREVTPAVSSRRLRCTSPVFPYTPGKHP